MADAPDQPVEEEGARITRYADVLCALVLIMGENIVLSLPPDVSEQARLVVADLGEAGIIQARRTLNSGIRPFRFRLTDSCIRRGRSLLG